ncbi:chitinase [Streptomyces sp. bgisy100]|uniref:chitinase n=1 Tax=Streptomyces sp. bgisy100 TaxID=3413783 RepID=UPI003D7055EB
MSGHRSRFGGFVGAVALTMGCAAAAVWVGGSGPAEDRSASGPSAARHARVTPYLSAWAARTYDMAAAVPRGIDEFTLAFVVAGRGCAPRWDGGTALDDSALKHRIAALRKAGGDVRVSFGGAEGTEPARVCRNATELAAAYGTVIDRYRLTRIDFDVEGATLADTAASTRRARAAALLQRSRPSLEVSFTLPAMPSGLTAPGLALLKEARARGVTVSAVNVMAMNYGAAHTGDMGTYAVRAATAAHGQLRQALRLSPAGAWKALAVTPMIGLNDVPGEVFTVRDATALARFAADKGVGRLSMWSAERDRPCAAATDKPAVRCSGVTQRRGDFAAALSRTG